MQRHNKDDEHPDDEDFNDPCHHQTCTKPGIWYHNDKAYCNRCFARLKYDRTRLKRRKAQGRCGCGRIPETDKKTCTTCLNSATAKRHKLRTNASSPVCSNCLRIPPAEGKRLCRRCLDSKTAAKRKNKQKGLCPCGKRRDRNDTIFCPQCRDNDAKRYKINKIKKTRLQVPPLSQGTPHD